METAFHSDALEKFDANLNAFFARELEQINQKIYARKYPELKGRILVPVKNDINPGAQSLTNRTIDEAGQAEFVEDYGDDAPLVEITGAAEDNFPMRRIQLGYGWHVDEARAAIYVGRSLPDMKAMACRRRIEKFIDKNLLLGSTTGGLTLQGLFSLSGSQAPVTYTPSNLTWEDENSDDILADLNGIADKIYTDSKEVETPDTMVFPTSTLRLIANRRMGDANNMSILKYFLSENDFIKNVYSSLYLEKSSQGGLHSGGDVKRMVCYRRDSEVLEGLVNEFEQFPPEYKSMRVVTICSARVGGVMTHYPKAIAYGDGI